MKLRETHRSRESGSWLNYDAKVPITLQKDAPNDRGLIASATDLAGRWKNRFDSAAPVVAAFWLIGAMFFSLRPVIGMWHVQRLRRCAAKAKPNQLSVSLQRRAGELATRLRLARAVTVVQLAMVRVPTAIGFMRPMVLMPASAITGLSPRELDAILLHELAHLKRWDDVAVYFQSIVESLFFFHPAVWWMSKVANQERENCCDDIACEAEGSRSTLASALLKLAQARGNSRLALNASGRLNQISH